MSPFLISAFADEIDMNLEIQIESLQKLGIGYIELRGVNGKNIVEVTLDEAHYIKSQLDQAGIKVSAIGSPIGKVSILDDFELELERFKHILDLSKILETQYIRMFSFFMPKDEDPEIYFEEVVRRWECYLEVAQIYDVVLLHENEKGIYGDTADRCKKLLERLQSNKVSMTFDPANFVQVGEDVSEAYEKLKEYILYVHMKDADKEGQNVPVGMGEGQIKSLLGKLDAGQYKGFLSLEPHLTCFEGRNLLEDEALVKESKEYSSYELFEIAYAALKKLLKI